LPDFPIVDSHVHLADPSRLGYAWTANAPSLKRTVLPHDLKKAAAPVTIESFVFVEVDVDFPPSTSPRRNGSTASRSRSHRASRS
jgi:L-fuconolactonase